MATNENFPMVLPQIRPYRLMNTRMVPNFHLVWLDANIDQTDTIDECHLVDKLADVSMTIDKFSDADKCIEFINRIKDKTFLVVSDDFLHTVIPTVQDLPQINYIYILSQTNLRKEIWPKVSGVYNDVTLLYEALRHGIEHSDHNSLSMSLVRRPDTVIDQSFDTLHSSFIFMEILKNILLTLDFDEEHRTNFFSYCREQFADNSVELKNINMVEKEYHSHQPIWWYTYDCFLYFELNRALRTMEVDLIMKMAFFLRDLHNQITRLHAKQYSELKHPGSFVVYRGQGLSQTDFTQLKTNQGGILAFNNFLSTSQNADVSLSFAQRAIMTSYPMGVLFIITVDPAVSGTPFANVEAASCYEREEEILFSIQSVFRIGQMQRIEKDDRLWQVELTLTSDNDPQLQTITNNTANKVERLTEWFRLGELMIQMGQSSKAEQVYELLLNRISDDQNKADIYDRLGRVKDEQEKYAEAILDLDKSLEIREKLLPVDHSLLCLTHFNIARILQNLHQDEEALKHVTQAMAIVSRIAVMEQIQMQTIEEQLDGFLSTILSKDEIEKIRMTHWMYPVLLVLPSLDQSRLLSIFHNITDEHLLTPILIEQCQKNLSLHKKVKSIAVELSTTHSDERNSLLEVLSSYPSVDSIYILTIQSSTHQERRELCTRFPKICILCEDPTKLVLRWIMNTIEDYWTLGDRQIKENQKSNAQVSYDHGMKLVDQLSKLIN